jgi:hypothetical protein
MLPCFAKGVLAARVPPLGDAAAVAASIEKASTGAAPAPPPPAGGRALAASDDDAAPLPPGPPMDGVTAVTSCADDPVLVSVRVLGEIITLTLGLLLRGERLLTPGFMLRGNPSHTHDTASRPRGYAPPPHTHTQ